MITRFQIENFGCIKKVDFALTPLHAFIGPNDSGKSTILRAMHEFVVAASGLGELPHVSMGATTPSGSYSIKSPDGANILESVSLIEGVTQTEASPPSGLGGMRAKHPRFFETEFRGATVVRFDPDRMREPSPLLIDGRPTSLIDERGHGLAGVLQAIQGRGNDDYANLTRAVRDLFPTVRWIQVPAISSNRVALAVQLTNGVVVPAAQLGEGLLYWIGFSALRFVAPVSLLLVEEPENGLHPSRVAEVIKILRTITKGSGTQVVLATHSPLVINELEADEVSLVTRTSLDRGTCITPIAETPNFAKRSSVYALGELWLSYANGVDEAPLLDAKTDVSKAAG